MQDAPTGKYYACCKFSSFLFVELDLISIFSPTLTLGYSLIFPDLNAGNNGYKAVQQASKTIAVGPVLQGLKMPVNDLSRGATVDDIVNTAVVTALQAADNDLVS